MRRALDETYDPIKYMIRRYPRAAKKRRIIKKWKRRFGPSISDILFSYKYTDIPFLKLSNLDSNEFAGKYIPIFIDYHESR